MKLATLGNRVRRALRGGSPGVTLIEALVAIVLVAIIAAAFMGALAVAARSAAIADIRTNAESLARSELEYVKSQQYQPAPWEYEVTSAGTTCNGKPPDWCDTARLLPQEYDGYRVEVSTSALLDEDEDPKVGIQIVTVKVFYPSMYGDHRVITLEGYNRDRR